METIEDYIITVGNDERLECTEVFDLSLTAVQRVLDGNNPSLHVGQTLYAVLYERHPELALKIFKTTADPFYEPNNIVRFLNAIIKQP